MADIVLADIAMADIAMADIVMAYAGMAHIGTVRSRPSTRSSCHRVVTSRRILTSTTKVTTSTSWYAP